MGWVRRVAALRVRRTAFPWPLWELANDEGTSVLLWPGWPPRTDGEDQR